MSSVGTVFPCTMRQPLESSFVFPPSITLFLSETRRLLVPLLFPLPHLHLQAVSPALTADLLLKYLDVRLQAPLRNCAVTLTVNKSMGQVQTPVEMYERKQVHLEATGRDLQTGELQKRKNGMQMYAQP